MEMWGNQISGEIPNKQWSRTEKEAEQCRYKTCYHDTHRQEQKMQGNANVKSVDIN